MNKKIIISLIIIVILVSGGLIFYVNKINSTDNIKNFQANIVNENGELVTNPNAPQVVKDIDSAYNFFEKCIYTSFNVSNTEDKEIMTKINDFQKENFYEGYLPMMDGVYKKYKSLQIKDFTTKGSKFVSVKLQDGTEIPGIEIKYYLTIITQDGAVETIGNENEDMTALITYDENGKFTLEDLMKK